VDLLCRIGGVATCDAYQWSTSSWDMACTDHMCLEYQSDGDMQELKVQDGGIIYWRFVTGRAWQIDIAPRDVSSTPWRPLVHDRSRPLRALSCRVEHDIDLQAGARRKVAARKGLCNTRSAVSLPSSCRQIFAAGKMAPSGQCVRVGTSGNRSQTHGRRRACHRHWTAMASLTWADRRRTLREASNGSLSTDQRRTEVAFETAKCARFYGHG